MHDRLAGALALGFVTLSAALPASAARPLLSVTESVKLSAPPAKTWAAVKNFDGLHTWHPGFTSTELVKGKNNVAGAMRILTLKDGARLTEKLTSYDSNAMSMSYRITDGPLPITRYRSTIQVTPANGGSLLTWSSTFRGKSDPPKEGEDDASLKELISGVYTAGFDNLKTTLAK
jgi:carbon monoxide dehydrogenase subunit G